MRIRLARVALRESQDALATRAGVSRVTLGSIERGQHPAGALTFIRLSRAIGTRWPNCWTVRRERSGGADVRGVAGPVGAVPAPVARLTTRQLAERAGMAPATVNSIELGRPASPAAEPIRSATSPSIIVAFARPSIRCTAFSSRATAAEGVDGCAGW